MYKLLNFKKSSMFAFRHSLLFLIGAQAFLQAQAPGAAGAEFFEKKIRPVLASRCYPCHGASSPKVQGGLRLDSRDGLRKGGNSGSPIVPGDPDASLLIKALRHTDETVKMPPGKPLNPEVVANFEQWVQMGAPDPRVAPIGIPVSNQAREFWSFRKPVMPAFPNVANAKWARTPVDRFILAKLEEAKLSPSPDADKRTLLRRASFDLIGLPPSPKEVDDFLKDDSPNAYEQVVDRLLASPQYGERWGRHWMDVSRYADTADGNARFAFSYTYRDWVIRAFNQDMPYTEFVKKQIAADQMDLTHGGKRDLAALGYMTLGRSVPKGEHDMIDDRIDVVTRGLLGLTVTCARCHDHKFDPIPTRDYYSFYGMIANSIEPQEYPLMETENEDSPLVREYREGMRRRLKAIDDFKVRRHAELVAEYRTGPWISRYMIAAEQASKMSNTEIEKLSRDRDFNLYALRRWRDYLNATRANGDPVFAPWHALAARTPDALRAVSVKANPELMKALTAKPVASLEEAAEVYGATLAKFDSDKPNADPAAEQLRLALRGEGTPTNIPLSAFM
ncbi:MAG: DUF1549 domain-containing protein, partial [Acidobacteriota bacterium]|nr:DUF1549 domain-containing protein [Acidobacteriota bacterium]